AGVREQGRRSEYLDESAGALVDVRETPRYTRPDRPLKEALMVSIATAQRAIGRALPPWWLFLITGVAWMLVALILLRFDYTSVSSISLLFGFVAIAAGVVEIGMMLISPGWWKLLNGLLAL